MKENTDQRNTEREIVLECRGIHHWFGSHNVLFDLNLRIIRGEIVALVGPSGCGKSTLLRAIVGTHPPRRGQVLVRRDGQVTEVHQPGRDRGIVYQRYSLFPNLTALQNVAFGLMLDRTSIPFRLFKYPRWRRLRRGYREEAAAMLERLGLAAAMNNYPHELSGGMCQRVAIAQALVMKPSILLLDEPFGALDEATREELQRMLLQLYAENLTAIREGKPAPYTILMVTHEINEALFVSDRVVGLSQYWDWKSTNREFPGATIIYDNMAPVFQPESQRDFQQLVKQKDEILHAAFDPEYCQVRQQWTQFWDRLDAGDGHGVLK